MGLDFSVAGFRAIEPLCEKYFAFRHKMIFHEIVHYSNISDEVKKKCRTTDDYLDNMTNITFAYAEMVWYEELIKIFNNYLNLDGNIIDTILFMFIVSEHRRKSIQASDDLLNDDYMFNHQMVYAKYVRPEMLELFTLLKKVKSKKSKPFTIIYGDEKIKIDNTESWLTGALNTYLDKYLGVVIPKEAIQKRTEVNIESIYTPTEEEQEAVKKRVERALRIVNAKRNISNELKKLSEATEEERAEIEGRLERAKQELAEAEEADAKAIADAKAEMIAKLEAETTEERIARLARERAKEKAKEAERIAREAVSVERAKERQTAKEISRTSAIQVAEEELNTIYYNRGRKSNEVNDRMMMGIFRLLNDHSILKNKKEVLDLTLDILTYWEEVHYEKTNYFEKSDIKAFKDMGATLLNSKIAYLEKNNYTQTNQWSMGHYNFSPNNNPFPPQEDLSGLSEEEKYEKMINETLDNIHCW